MRHGLTVIILTRNEKKNIEDCIASVKFADDIIIVDSGVMFPEDDLLGIDYVIPDYTFLKDNENKIKALVITHGHEDHIGALPYLLRELPNVPVYASKLSVALIENKLKEHKKIKCKPICVKPKQVVKIGNFQVEFVKVTHSISGSMALAITTPVGVYFHTGDFKIDYTPIDLEIIKQRIKEEDAKWQIE